MTGDTEASCNAAAMAQMGAAMMCGMGANKAVTAQDKVTAEWDAMAGEWDDLASGYATAFYKMLKEKLPDLFDGDGGGGGCSESLVVVDFGCGTGLLTERLLPHASKIVAVDPSKQMIGLLQEKIMSRDAWTDKVTPLCAVLSTLNDEQQAATTTAAEGSSEREKQKQLLRDLEGTVDLIVASSVFPFIPPEDLEATMKVLVKLLKPGTGLLCHSDWPESEQHPDGMTEEKAVRMYGMAAAAAGDGDGGGGLLRVQSTQNTTFHMQANANGGPPEAEVFIGIAEKVKQ